MNFFYKNKKTIFINILILVTFLLIPPIALFTYQKSKHLYIYLTNKSTNVRSNYPVYKNPSFAPAHYNALDFEIKSEYKSYVGWIMLPFKSKGINISNKFNSRLSKGENLKNSTWFFGGSTMWGYGSSDYETIPSLYNIHTQEKVFNFGQVGWNSRQSLNQLITAIKQGESPKVVVFYNGVNAVMQGCVTSRKDLYSHAQEENIKEYINNNKSPYIFISKNIIKTLTEPYRKYVMKRKSTKSNTYNCHENKSKAIKIANSLVDNWYIAFLISKANESDFYAILQPNLFSSGTTYDYFAKSEKSKLPHMKKQYETLYPLIRKSVKTKCLKDQDFCDHFFDSSNWIDKNSKVFVDDNHLTGEGNNQIAKKLAQLIKKNTSGSHK